MLLAKHPKLDRQSCINNLPGDVDSFAGFVIFFLCFSASRSVKKGKQSFCRSSEVFVISLFILLLAIHGLWRELCLPRFSRLIMKSVWLKGQWGVSFIYHLRFSIRFWHWLLVEMSLFAEFRVLLSWLCLPDGPAVLLAAKGCARAVLHCW